MPHYFELFAALLQLASHMMSFNAPTRVLAFLLVGGVLLGAPLPILGSHPAPPDSPATRTIVDFLRREIRSDDLARREHALMDVIPLVNCRTFCTVRLLSADKTVHVQNDPTIGSMLDLSGLAPDLLWVYRTGPSDGLRLLALSGLLHLRNETGLDTLIPLSVRMSARVQQATYRGLAAVFLEQYPALHDQVTSTRTLSMADILRARAQRPASSSAGPSPIPGH